MIRRIAILILLVCYLGGAQGQWLQYHYCMGELASIEKAKKAEKKCAKCGMKPGKTKSCCATEEKWVKISDDHSKADFHFSEPSFALGPALIQFQHPAFLVVAPAAARIGFRAHAPPSPTSLSIHKRIGVFRI